MKYLEKQEDFILFGYSKEKKPSLYDVSWATLKATISVGVLSNLTNNVHDHNFGSIP